jgi:mRNA-degrading endonuclease RelE of RelBE toxin-antitoxin system
MWQMPTFRIELTIDAEEDLSFYRPFEQRIVVTAVRDQLSQEPMVETRNRKSLRENPLARWELRVGKYRVFYDPDEGRKIVTVVSIGHKIQNRLIIRGKEVQL